MTDMSKIAMLGAMAQGEMTPEAREALEMAEQFAEGMEPEKAADMPQEPETPEAPEVSKTEGTPETPEKVSGEVMPKPEGTPEETPAKTPKKSRFTKKSGEKAEKPKKKTDAKPAVKEKAAPADASKIQRELVKRSGIIEKNLASIENSFLIIAFQLHWIKRNTAYKDAGFKNIYDYAEMRHGIGRTSCSNLICIVENFAERDEKGQVVEKIAECYQQFKQSQLVAMLGMPPEQIGKIDKDTSVRDILQMKKGLEIVQDGGEDGEEGAEGEPEVKKKVSNTLMKFSDLNEYKCNVEQVDILIERAFKKSKTPVTIKIICEQG